MGIAGSTQEAGGLRGAAAYITMAAEVLQKLDLAQGPLSQNLFAEDIGDFFDGNTFAGLNVGGGAVCWK